RRGGGAPACGPADADRPAVPAGLSEEGPRGEDLEPCRTPVRGLRPWVGGNDVPAQGVQLELGEDPPDDRGRRLRRPAAAELTFRRERQTGNPRAAIARSLTYEKQ